LLCHKKHSFVITRAELVDVHIELFTAIKVLYHAVTDAHGVV